MGDGFDLLDERDSGAIGRTRPAPGCLRDGLAKAQLAG
jgi:hypothetical protein